VSDERAESFHRLSRAVGGIVLTEYQPEVDLEIEARIKSVIEQLRSTNAELFALVARFGEELHTDYRNRLLSMFENNAASVAAADRAANTRAES
jgi:hypothetical protein